MSDKDTRSVDAMDEAWQNADLDGLERAMQEYADDDEVVICVRIQNSQARSIQFILEPWADEMTLPPSTSVMVCMCGPKQASTFDKLNVEYQSDQLILYGWGGSIVYMLQFDDSKLMPTA